MSTIRLKVPRRLVLEHSIEFVKEIRSISEAEKIIFDFSDLHYIDPLSLLYVSSEIKNCRDTFTNSNFVATNYEGSNCSYMAHMGFFKSFGLEYGKNPGQASGSASYIPMSIFNANLIRKDAREMGINPAVLLEDEAKNLALILTQNGNKELNEVLTYCLREIFRNVLEHSDSIKFGYCAQYFPSKNEVSLAIIDRGMGLKNSLLNNPKLEIESDRDAIYLSLSPGISGKVYSGQKRKPKGEWANSGYGLYMTSNICKKGGSFFIASGETGILITDKFTREFKTLVQGTALSLTINTSRIESLDKMLKEIRDNISLTTTTTTTLPSKSTMGLKNWTKTLKGRVLCEKCRNRYPFEVSSNGDESVTELADKSFASTCPHCKHNQINNKKKE